MKLDSLEQTTPLILSSFTNQETSSRVNDDNDLKHISAIAEKKFDNPIKRKLLDQKFDKVSRTQKKYNKKQKKQCVLQCCPIFWGEKYIIL